MSGKDDEVFFPGDFSDLGNECDVACVLSSLHDKGRIWRLREDIYCAFKKTRFGEILPCSGSLILSYSKKTGAVFTETGAFAANILGYSTQNVLRETYLTSGQPMVWDFKGTDVTFKKGSPAELLFGNKPEGTLVRAWLFMGREESSDCLGLIYKNKASQIDWNSIVKAYPPLPRWMADLAKRCKRKFSASSCLPTSL